MIHSNGTMILDLYPLLHAIWKPTCVIKRTRELLSGVICLWKSVAYRMMPHCWSNAAWHILPCLFASYHDQTVSWRSSGNYDGKDEIYSISAAHWLNEQLGKSNLVSVCFLLAFDLVHRTEQVQLAADTSSVWGLVQSCCGYAALEVVKRILEAHSFFLIFVSASWLIFFHGCGFIMQANLQNVYTGNIGIIKSVSCVHVHSALC